MNKNQFSKEAYKDFEMFWGFFIENAKAQKPNLPEEEIKEWEIGAREYFALRDEMELELSEQRELEIKQIFTAARKVQLDDEFNDRWTDAAIYSVDAQMTYQYGQNIGKAEIGIAMQFALLVAATMDYVTKIIGLYPFHADVVERYGEEKAAKFFAAYFPFMEFHQPFRNETHLHKKMNDFFYAIGYKRKPTRNKKKAKKPRKFEPHFKLYSRLLKSKLKKYQEMNDTKIIECVCREIEGNDDLKTVYRVRAGIRRHQDYLEQLRDQQTKK